jgi:hypothetical protein
MTRKFPLTALLGFVALVGLAQPSDVFAQRRPPAGGAPRVGVAVPRGHAPSPSPYHPYYNRPYYSRPYYYRPYYYPYYSYPYHYYAPWYFSFGVGFGWGAYAPYAYSYPYPYYAYPYPAPSYDNRGAAPPAYSVEPGSRPNDNPGFGTLSLRVMPSDATILIDGHAWDVAPGDNRFSIELTEGPHQVEVRKEGYGSYVRTIDVPQGRTLIWNVSLTPAGSSSRVNRTVPMIAQRR